MEAYYMTANRSSNNRLMVLHCPRQLGSLRDPPQGNILFTQCFILVPNFPIGTPNHQSTLLRVRVSLYTLY